MKSSLHLRRNLIEAPSRHATALRSFSALSVALTAAILSSLSSLLSRRAGILSSGFPSLRLSFSPSFCLRHLRESLRAVARRPRNLLAVAVPLALTANIASSLATYPHTLSYFNELAGGPLNGPAHLLDANVDWGQDLLFLKDLQEVFPSLRNLSLRFFGPISPNVAGISFELLSSFRIQESESPRGIDDVGDGHGCKAVSINDLYGYKHFGDNSDDWAVLRIRCAIARVGYSIIVFGEGLHTVGATHLRSRHSQAAFPKSTVLQNPNG